MNHFMNYDFNIQNITLASYIDAQRRTPIHHNRSSHGLVFYTQGPKKYIFDESPQIITQKNDILYLPKHSNYIVDTAQFGGCYAINFNISEPVDFQSFLFKCKNTSFYFDSFKNADYVWKSQKPGYQMKCKSILYNIIYQMQADYRQVYIPKSRQALILPAVEYIHAHYTNEQLSITKLSAMCQMSPEYFRNLFHSFYGTSPVKYINNLKITRAAELIASGMYSISQAATLSGYNDASHFSREFKKAIGVSPSEYSNR